MFETACRHFLSKHSIGIGGAAIASLLPERSSATAVREKLIADHAPKAKRVIYLFMSGGPSHMDLFDFNPKHNEFNG